MCEHYIGNGTAMRYLLLLCLASLLSFNSFGAIISLGKLQRDENSSIITSSLGLEFHSWLISDTYSIKEWEAEFSDSSSYYFGWRLADANEAFAMLKDAGLSVFSWRRLSPTTGVFDVPWEADCYDNNASTVCDGADRWGANFNLSSTQVGDINYFFTGSRLGTQDPNHNSIHFKNNPSSFANTLDGHTYGNLTTHFDGGAYINASPSAYTENDVNGAFKRGILNGGRSPLLVRDAVNVSEPTGFFLMLFSAFLVFRKIRNDKPNA